MINNRINKIFQIGFNKCGTTSIHEVFCTSKIHIIHWDNGLLAQTIKKNIDNNHIPLLGQYHNYNIFSDMEFISNDKMIFIYQNYFKDLDIAYPNSKFILNIRPLNNWINSRLNHTIKEPFDYQKIYMKFYKLNNTEELVDLWKREWDTHITNVITYFYNRPNDLLIFDIENDNFQLFINFFYDILFSFNQLPKTNTTVKDRSILNQTQGLS